MGIVAGLVAMATGVFVAIAVDTEVVAGFNVDGLGLILLAVGAAFVVRGLLPSRHEVRLRTATHAERADVTSPVGGRYGQVRLG